MRAPRVLATLRQDGHSVGAAIAVAVVALSTLPVAKIPLAAQDGASLSEEVREYVSVDATVVALVGVTVLDGTGAPARPGQTVLIREGRIAAVGPSAEVEVPDDAERHELEGHTVIPGMVGLHNHVFYMAAGGRQAQLNYSAPRLYLGSGVTTIRTTGSVSPYADLNLKTSIDAGETPGPRVHVTAPYMTGGSGGPVADMAELTSPEEARRFARYWAEEGATWLKAYTTIHREELAAAIEEAHAAGMKVTGHLCSVTFSEAVDLGIDNLEHGFSTATDLDSRKQPDECPPGSMMVIGEDADPAGPEAMAVIEKLVEHEVPMTSTLAVIEPFIPNRPVTDKRTLEAMAPEVREAYLDLREQIDAAGPEFPFQEVHLKKNMAFERAFVEAGGLLAAGVDPTGNGGALPGFGDQRNYELFIEAGFTPARAVQILTLNGAKVLGADDELGSVEAGKRADLVVLRGDPAADPSAIRDVVLVFKDGVGYDSAKLIDSVKGRVGIN